MTEQARSCIVCQKYILNVFAEVENQPSDGVAFTSEGHYGSTVWDPMDGQYIEVNICDECLVKRAREGFVLQNRNRRPVICDNLLVGWEYVKREYVVWDGERGADRDDCFHVNPDEVGSDDLTRTAEGRVRIEWLQGKVLKDV